ncbi:MAG TPA: LytTR family DNA-binding domain-containing protein [Pyrinomonadaceae bacterium]|nr:LytTR family DNA-binding domain-containing protein [Pyrinomonadaceae bacterium]
MNDLRVVIADDERPAREYLKALLTEFDSVTVIGEAENGSEAVDLIVETKPDLALLDLQMPELSGIEVVRSLRKTQMPLIAFVTAYDRFAVQAFELNAVDYLLKPVDRARLQQTFERAAERLEHSDWRETENQRLAGTVETLADRAANRKIERIPVRHRNDYYFVPVGDIVLLTADGELLNIITKDRLRYVINFRLKDIETKLDDDVFVRLSRSAIANIEHIERISPMPGGTYLVTLTTGQEITSSRLQSKIIRANLLKL